MQKTIGVLIALRYRLDVGGPRFPSVGLVTRPSFRLPGSPVTEVVTIALLVAVLGLMWNDPEVGRKTLLFIPVIAALLVGGWFALRRRISKAADQELTELLN